MLANLRQHLNLTSDMLVFLIGVIAVALVGGLVPAVIAAVVGSLFLNYYFTPPLYTFTISEVNNALALVVFVIVAVVVSSIVDDAAKRSKQAARASAESDLLVTTAGSILRGEQPLQAVVDRVREAFGMQTVTLLERATGADGGRSAVTWNAVATSGDGQLARPEDGDVSMPVSDDLCLAARGRTLPAADRRVLGAFAAYAAAALEQQRLMAEAEAARPIAEADRMRAALLAAVSHDLRTPLASAKAAVTSLRSDDVQWAAEDSRRTARDRGRVARQADPAGREPARHEQAAGRGACRCSPGRPTWARSSPGRSTTSARRQGRAGRDASGPARGARRPWHPGARDLQPDGQRAPLLARLARRRC